MSDTLIRAPREEESSRVFELLKEYAEFDGSASALKATATSLHEELFSANPTLRSLVAVNDGKIIGILLYYYSFSSWQMKKCFWIEDLYLTEETRGLGVGRLFLLKAKEIAQEHNCARVDWHVRRSNEPAKGFYAHMGGEIDEGTLPVYWKV